jgi:drug/metabolite transporter (DMT)-like permease
MTACATARSLTATGRLRASAIRDIICPSRTKHERAAAAALPVSHFTLASFAPRPAQPPLHTLLAWYFVAIWGSGFIASKIGMQHAAPFTFLALRFAIGTACMVAVVLLTRPAWPRGAALAHVVVAGLLMHAIHLSGSHYTQYLGMSAGITAVLLCIQPLLTALIAARWMHERLSTVQWAGIALGLAGVTLIVWHKIDARVATGGSLIAVSVALIGVTAGALYQRVFCPRVDLRAAALLQFAATFMVLTPLALAFEDNTIRWSWQLAGALLYLIIFASLLAVSAWHYLMRHGGATRVASLVYLTPAFAIVPEFLWFGITPSTLSWAGIVITCMGVALVAWRGAPETSA